MLMYSTIVRVSSPKYDNGEPFRTDATICKMIVAGFTGQLKGWWDNFLSNEERQAIFEAKNQLTGVDILGRQFPAEREDTIYTLMLTIIQYFGGRFTNQHENIRTLLNSLRCRYLGKFRWYKDTFLARVMDLPEFRLEHWKSRFIDGVPPLFAERVRKSIKGQYGAIPWTDFTYGQLLAACTEEGLKICNELKLSRQIKLERIKERTQLGDFYGQFGMKNSASSKKGHKTSNPEKPHRRKRYRHRSKEEHKAKKFIVRLLDLRKIGLKEI